MKLLGMEVAVSDGQRPSPELGRGGGGEGGTSITTSSGGSKTAEIRYMPWGGARYTSGTTPTTFRYTGQREQSEIGLYFYNARWYDAALGRFAQADSLIPNPGDPASYDRYSYSYGNPVKYIDPTGHSSCIPKQCGYTHDYDEAWSPVKELVRLRSLYGEFAEVVHIDDWDPSYNPEADPYLSAAREGDIAGIWASDVSAIDRRAGWERDPQGTANLILLSTIAGVGEGVAYNLPQFSSLLAARNIYGRLGGAVHQSTIDEIKNTYPSEYGSGYRTQTEYRILTPGGIRSSRFTDVAVLSPAGDPVAFYQVGVSTQGGLPVARERYAISDTEEFSIFGNIPIIFIPYK